MSFLYFRTLFERYNKDHIYTTRVTVARLLEPATNRVRLGGRGQGAGVAKVQTEDRVGKRLKRLLRRGLGGAVHFDEELLELVPEAELVDPVPHGFEVVGQQNADRIIAVKSVARPALAHGLAAGVGY